MVANGGLDNGRFKGGALVKGQFVDWSVSHSVMLENDVHTDLFIFFLDVRELSEGGRGPDVWVTTGIHQ